MRKLLVSVAVVAMVAAAIGVATAGNILSSAHNMSGTYDIAGTEVCSPCHSPHGSSSSDGYLWAHTDSTGPWTPHAKGSLNMDPTSLLCLGCHDGTIGVNEFALPGGRLQAAPRAMTGSALFGTDLSKDHPIGVTYVPSSKLNTPDDPIKGKWTNGIRLVNDKVECRSCHSGHGTSNDFMLRASNEFSGVCFTCHNK